MGHHHTIGQGPVSLWHQTIDMAAVTEYAGILVMQRGQCVFLNGHPVDEGLYNLACLPVRKAKLCLRVILCHGILPLNMSSSHYP